MRNRLSYANVAATLALVLVIAGGGSAIAEPIVEPIADTAASTVTRVKEALRISRESNKRSKRALTTARSATTLAKSAKAAADSALEKSADTYSKAASDERYMLKAGVPVRALAADTADTAGDADKLDGLDSTTFARAGQTAKANESNLISNTNVNCVERIGPSVTVEVGPSGLVAVYAEATLAAGSTDPSRAARAQLYEPTAFPGCETILLRTDIAPVRVRTAPGSGSGTINRGGWLIFDAPPGERTFSLRYGHTGNGNGILGYVENSVLSVVPL